MSSWVIENCTIGNIYVDYFWDKYAPHYHVFVGRKGNNGLSTIKDLTYGTVEKAKQSYQRQVRLVKKGEIK